MLACGSLNQAKVHASYRGPSDNDCLILAVKNHGIEKKLVDAVFEENKKFFALPLAKKMEIAAGNVKQYRYLKLPHFDDEQSIVASLSSKRRWFTMCALSEHNLHFDAGGIQRCR